MGFFDRFSKAKPADSVASRKAPPVPSEIAAAFGMVAALTPSDDPMEGFVCIPVAGESQYQDALQELRDALDVFERIGHGFVAVLVPEPDNPHDSSAIAVTSGGNTLGYVRADVARDWQPFLRSLEGPIECSARLTGGTSDKPSIGVVLDFALLKDLKQKIGIGS